MRPDQPVRLVRPEGPGRLVRLAEPALVGAFAAAGVGVVAAVDPEHGGHYPGCPFRALTGLYCPLCGGLRAVHALTRGDLGLAMARNPVVVVGVPIAVWAYAAWVRRRWAGRAATWYPGPGLTRAGFAFLLVFTVLRNLPGFSWLGP